MLSLAAAGPSAYWYLARGTGVVALLLLTASVVLGLLDSLRVAFAPRWPRFAIDSLHRDVSLLVIAMLAVHIVTSVLDGFAPISLVDAVIPVGSSYRPFWLGLGALSFDLLIALVLTSLLRRRLGYRAWRAIHWLAYGSWPVAVLHGLGTGTDTTAWWNLFLTFACVAAVCVAVLVRLARASAIGCNARAAAAVATVVTPIGLAAFTLLGPLAPHWARRSGTPRTLLASVRGPTRSQQSRQAAPTLPFSAQLRGTVRQTPKAGGAIVDLALRFSGQKTGRLRVRMGGTPLAGGGLSMTGSQVDLVAPGLPSAMQGRIVSLQGQEFLARVSDSSGAVWNLDANLSIDNSTDSVSGTLSATGAGGR
jgi:hypothetical protein